MRQFRIRYFSLKTKSSIQLQTTSSLTAAGELKRFEETHNFLQTKFILSFSEILYFTVEEAHFDLEGVPCDFKTAKLA